MQLSLDIVDSKAYRPKKVFQNKSVKEIQLRITEFTEITTASGSF